MKRLLVAVALITTPALAQQPTEYTLKLSPQEMAIVGTALGKQPFNEVAPLINKLQQQVQTQERPSVHEPPKPTPESNK